MVNMLKANNFLKNDYPSIDGLQDTLLQKNGISLWEVF